MQYGYKSQWFGDDAIQLKVSTMAQRLLLSLKHKRKVWPLSLSVIHCSAHPGLGMALSASDLHRALFWGAGDPQGPFYLGSE